MNTINDIPLIDISPLLSNPDRSACTEVIEQIRVACAEVGVLYVTGHGITDEQTNAVFEQSKLFFESPLEEKMKIHRSNSPIYRGYTPYKEEQTKEQPDLHESLDMARHIPFDPKQTPLFAGPNQWPEHLPLFEPAVVEYFDAASRAGKGLARGIFYSLNATDEFVKFNVDGAIEYLRQLYYPGKEVGQGIGEHVDYGVATLLAQDTVGGLEVQKADGTWVEAPYVEGALPVVIGNMVQVTSNDLYKATWHRVHATNKERYSVPFFMGPNLDCVIQPLDSLCSEESPAKYKPYHYGKSVLAAFTKSYGS